MSIESIERLLEVTWSNWKIFAARPGVLLFYVEFQQFKNYIQTHAIAIDLQFVYRAQFTNSPEDIANLADFTTNYLGISTLAASLEDAIAIANKSLDGGGVVLEDYNGNPLGVLNNTLMAPSQEGLIAAGWDGTDVRFLKTDVNGVLQTNASLIAQNVTFNLGAVDIHDSNGVDL